jgi:ParB-like chromosome segregation protein Spo0J
MKSAPRIELVPIAKLVPYARNARTHSPEQVAQIAASIGEFGWTNPVLIDDGNEVIAGHGRMAAGLLLGLAELPCIRIKGLSEAQRRALRIADNKLGLNAGWDDALLALELGDLQGLGFDLALTGFGEIELGALFAKPGLTDPDEVPEPPAEPVTLPGDLWVLGKHRLLCGDATNADDVAKVLGDVRPHLTVTDPPYGVDYDPTWRARRGVNLNKAKLGKVANDDRADWREAWALFPGDVIYCWHGAVHAAEVEASLVASGFEIRAQRIGLH